MGPNLDIKDVEKIESLVKTMDRELTPVEAKIVASMLQVILAWNYKTKKKVFKITKKAKLNKREREKKDNKITKLL